MATRKPLLTAEDYGRLPDNGRPTELVRGRIVDMKVTYPCQGEVCATLASILGQFAEDHDLGHVVIGSGVITERDPDTVRAADVAFYSYTRVPPGPLPDDTYLQVPPALVFEVRASDDPWRTILTKVAEFLNGGVSAVCVLDLSTQTVRVYDPDQPERTLTTDTELTLPEVLGDFRVVVRRFFE